MNFGQALEALKNGDRVSRAGWNGKGMWVREINLYLDQEFRVSESVERPSVGTWLPFLVMKTVDNTLVPWLASQTDVLAEDWLVVSS